MFGNALTIKDIDQSLACRICILRLEIPVKVYIYSGYLAKLCITKCIHC